MRCGGDPAVAGENYEVDPDAVIEENNVTVIIFRGDLKFYTLEIGAGGTGGTL